MFVGTFSKYQHSIYSVVEPIRDFIKRTRSNAEFYEAECVDVDLTKKQILCRGTFTFSHYKLDTSDVKSNTADFQLPYDHLVLAIGAVNNTYNTPGIDFLFIHLLFQGVQKNAHFMKQVEGTCHYLLWWFFVDALEVRRKVIDLFETANLPGTSPEERKRLLHFVICGGGPTGEIRYIM